MHEAVVAGGAEVGDEHVRRGGDKVREDHAGRVLGGACRGGHGLVPPERAVVGGRARGGRGAAERREREHERRRAHAAERGGEEARAVGGGGRVGRERERGGARGGEERGAQAREELGGEEERERGVEEEAVPEGDDAVEREGVREGGGEPRHGVERGLEADLREVRRERGVGASTCARYAALSGA